MRKLYCILLSALFPLCFNALMAQTPSTDDYRTATGAAGTWATVSNWQRWDGSAWVAATAAPTLSSSAIEIRSDAQISVTSSVEADQLIVRGILILNNPFTVKDGNGTDLTIASGGQVINSNPGNGQFNLVIEYDSKKSIAATAVIASGGTYVHNTTKAVTDILDRMILEPASNFIYRGAPGASPSASFAGKTYGNLSFESTGGTYTITATGSTLLTVLGNLQIGANVIFSTPSIPLALKGNWTNNGTYNKGTETITFNGAIAQAIGGNNATTFNNITVNNIAGVTLAKNATVTALTLTSGNLSIGANSLTINGAVIGNGTLSGSPTSNLVIGGAAGTLNFTTGANDLLALTLNNNASATLGSALNIVPAGVLSVGSSATLNANGNLTMKADGTGTARIAALGTGGAINGDVTVETYIPGRRAYRQLAAGVRSAATIQTNWQEGKGTYVANRGIFVTGSKTGSNGFDASTSGSANVYTFNTTTSAYEALANTDVLKLNPFSGYRVFVYGDRDPVELTLTNIATGTTDNRNFQHGYTVLRAKGSLITGTVTYNNSGASVNGGTADAAGKLSNVENGYSLISNPYWSPVDFNAISKTGVNPTYWVWDPTVGNRGAYISYTSGSASAGGLTQYIQAGQAIFVQTSAANPVITFTESNKASTYSNKGMKVQNTEPAKFTVQLYENGRLQENRQMQDATAVAFRRDFNTAVGMEDAEKFINSDENIAIVRNNATLGVEGRPLLSADTIQLRMWKLAPEFNYSLKITGERFGAGVEAYLQDRYENKMYPLNAAGSTVVPFSFSADSATFYNRFRIIMSAPKTEVKASPKSVNKQLLVYPNPVRTGVITIDVPELQPGKYLVIISNAAGQKVFEKSFEHVGGYFSEDVVLPSYVKKGLHSVQLGNAATQYNQKIIVQ